jgi:hypothetical protein
LTKILRLPWSTRDFIDRVVTGSVNESAVRAEPIHSMDVDTLVDAVAPTLQRYLTGDLS